MYLAHYAVALASKKAAPQASLGTYVLAVQFLDLIWPFFLLLGWENVTIEPGITRVTPFNFYHYPISHSLAAALCWAVLVAGIYWIWKRQTKEALVLAGGVVSHWILDFVSHRPDVPLYPGGPKVGLGLWNSLSATFAVEFLALGIGSYLYIGSTRAKDKTGSIAFWSLIVFLVATYFASVFGAPPPDVQTLAYSALALWLLVGWAYWIDLHREPTVGSGAQI